MLFASDDELRDDQRRGSAVHGSVAISEEARWLVQVEDARERRMHQRIRAFAWWLLIFPPLAALVTLAAQWIVPRVLAFLGVGG